ncbi:hypothetical protein [Paenibacillus soyae]|uniref:Uncharacterized protein n=1 Tax=Paenibacillus soyae TaxID=2969249 RepID=A0A9X2MT19_9BACL|nr:hypothetical protein [Paenibacillus soyae]MCR2805323.1 hypothetical protein [Paenibacillus soyae]
MPKRTFNIRQFNMQTGEFKNDETIDPLPVSYSRSNEVNGFYELTLAAVGLRKTRQSAFVSPASMQKLLPAGADPAYGYVPVRCTHLAEIGFDLRKNGRRRRVV